MNQHVLQQYISEYKREFARISNEEIYKWRAVKHFQDCWDPDADDFAEMLSSSLGQTSNLMVAGRYFPRGQLNKIARKNPQPIKKAFLDLFEEDEDLIDRIVNFRSQIKEINSRDFPGDQDYQDHRAVMVYLNLKYPDTYYLYKFKMFENFCQKVEASCKPTTGSNANITQYLNLCQNVRDELVLHDDLLELHNGRIGETEYPDRSYHLLTQDFIYAVTIHLQPNEQLTPLQQSRLTFIDLSPEPTKKDFQLKGRYVDFASQQKRNSHMGLAGEHLVLDHERNNCNPVFREQIAHVSVTEGDGLGYDILSFDNAGNKKYIEVKTTTGSVDRAFYLTGNELKCSQEQGENYFLYRLFNLKEKEATAEFYILRGDLSRYCINPTAYVVTVDPFMNQAQT